MVSARDVPLVGPASGLGMRLLVARDRDAVGRLGAQVVAETLRARPDALISLTTGHTAAALYRALGALCRSGAADLSAARFVSSEEYAGVGPDDPISLFGWLRRDVLEPCHVPPASVLRLPGDAPALAAACRAFDAEIERAGDLDLVVQSIGANGHFGFNEPGSPRDAPSRAVALAPATVRSNAGYWRAGTRVPARGLTMGVRATLRARHVLLLASGAPKAAALARAIDGPIGAEAPCSWLRLAPRLTVIVDEAAAARLLVGRDRGHDEG